MIKPRHAFSIYVPHPPINLPASYELLASWSPQMTVPLIFCILRISQPMNPAPLTFIHFRITNKWYIGWKKERKRACSKVLRQHGSIKKLDEFQILLLFWWILLCSWECTRKYWKKSFRGFLQTLQRWKIALGKLSQSVYMYASVDLPLCPLLMLHPRTRRGQSLGSASEVPKFALTNQVITRGSSIWISKGRERVRRSCNCQAGMSFSFNPETQSAMATWLPHLITWISTLSMVLAGETSDTGD